MTWDTDTNNANQCQFGKDEPEQWLWEVPTMRTLSPPCGLREVPTVRTLVNSREVPTAQTDLSPHRTDLEISTGSPHRTHRMDLEVPTRIPYRTDFVSTTRTLWQLEGSPCRADLSPHCTDSNPHRVDLSSHSTDFGSSREVPTVQTFVPTVRSPHCPDFGRSPHTEQRNGTG